MFFARQILRAVLTQSLCLSLSLSVSLARSLSLFLSFSLSTSTGASHSLLPFSINLIENDRKLTCQKFFFYSIPAPSPFLRRSRSLPLHIMLFNEEAAWAFLQILQTQRKFALESLFYQGSHDSLFFLKKKTGEGGRCFTAPSVTQRSSTLCAPRGRWRGRDSSSAGSAFWLALPHYPPLPL